MRRIPELVVCGVTLGVCSAMLSLAGVGAASAASTPIALDGPQNGSRPLVRYDVDGGATFVAWSDPQAPDNGIELCVLALATTKCRGGGPVLLSVSNAQNPAIDDENPISLQGLTVAPDGDVTVVGMAVEGGSVDWDSDNTGYGFMTGDQGLQNGGDFISPVDANYGFDNAISLEQSNVGLLDAAGDHWSDSSVAGPESPPIMHPNSNQDNGGLYPGQPLNDGPSIAAEETPGVPGSETVVAVGDQFVGPNTTLPGCANNQGTGFGVDVGTVNGQSTAAGTLNQGIPAYKLLACSALNPTLSVGSYSKAPIGVLENEGNGISGAAKTYTVDYRPFIATATGGSFGAPTKLAQLPGFGTANDLALSNDAGDGVYAYWYESGMNYFDVDYSADDGRTWEGTEKVSDPKFRQYEEHPTLTGVGNGNFDIAFNANPGTGTETYLEQFNYNQMAPPVTAMVPTTATATSSTVTLTVSCSVTPCTVTVTITAAGATVQGASARSRSAKPVKLAAGKLTIAKAGKHSLKLHWDAIGRRLIEKDKKLLAKLALSTKTVRGTYASAHTLRITWKK